VTRRFRLTAPAQTDLIEALDYLAEHASVSIALKYDARLRSAVADLTSGLAIGHRRPDLTEHPVLFHTVWPYLIIFAQEIDGILIHAVVHGARDFAAIARDRL
jgi:antitoxin ParD1/3/4/toxin ParE1/3/4